MIDPAAFPQFVHIAQDLIHCLLDFVQFGVDHFLYFLAEYALRCYQKQIGF